MDSEQYDAGNVEQVVERVKTIDSAIGDITKGLFLVDYEHKVAYTRVLYSIGRAYLNIASLGLIFAMYLLRQAEANGGWMWVLFGTSIGFVIACVVMAIAYFRDAREVESMIGLMTAILDRDGDS